MFIQIIKYIFIIILLIVLIHYLWSFLLNSFTYSKNTKDVINYQTKKYRDLIDNYNLNQQNNNNNSWLEEKDTEKLKLNLYSLIDENNINIKNTDVNI